VKYFVVTNSTWFIYCNHPLDPNGTNLCLPFAVSQRNNEEWFDDKYISAKTDDSLLVFSQVRRIEWSFSHSLSHALVQQEKF
jgi:hypothetical protein